MKHLSIMRPRRGSGSECATTMKHRNAVRWGSGLSAATLAMLAWSSPAHANRTERWVDGDLVSVRVLVEGKPVPLYSQWWDGKRYFQAYQGHNYALEVRNRTSRRIGVLIAVDGLNVITGQRSDLDPDESMYVLDPRSRTVVRGWRTSLDDVQQFVFVDEERSYAERTGQANGDLGWVRVLAFEEVRPRIRYDRDWRRERRDEPQLPENRSKSAPQEGMSKPGARDEAADDRYGSEDDFRDGRSFPGTGWGEHRRDRVRRTEFAAAAAPSDQLVLRYEYADGLQALGLLPHRSRLLDRENGEFGFARPPRW